GRGAGRRRLGRAGRGVLDDAEHFADLHVGAGGLGNLAQHAILGGGDLDVDLVGLEFDEGVTRLNGVALVLEPARYARVDDRLTHFRNNDVRWHVRYFLAEVRRPDAVTGSSNARATSRS